MKKIVHNGPTNVTFTLECVPTEVPFLSQVNLQLDLPPHAHIPGPPENTFYGLESFLVDLAGARAQNVPVSRILLDTSRSKLFPYENRLVNDQGHWLPRAAKFLELGSPPSRLLIVHLAQIPLIYRGNKLGHAMVEYTSRETLQPGDAIILRAAGCGTGTQRPMELKEASRKLMAYWAQAGFISLQKEEAMAKIFVGES